MMLKYINLAQGTLKIPIDSHGRPAKVSMTHLDDIGRYVAAAIALPPETWPGSGIISIAGNTFTYKDVRDILEADCKLNLWHETVSAEDCDREKAAADEVLAASFNHDTFVAGMVAQMQKTICSGDKGASWVDNTFDQDMLDWKPVDLKEYLVKIWAPH